jgi:DNA polymerase-4
MRRNGRGISSEFRRYPLRAGSALSSRQRKIIHIDCDCFYAAIEMRDDPSLAGKPLAVGGSPDKRGVVATCNYEARVYGLHSAMAMRTAVKLCPDLTIVRPRMDVYKGVSREIHGIFRDYTDLIEPLSLDEAYLDVSDCQQFSGSATLIAQDIRRRVWSSLGITVSAGVAPNKFLAKIAAEKLARLGVQDCRQLRDWSRLALVREFGGFGERLWNLARGIDERPVQVDSRRQSISVENTFDRDLPDVDACLAELPGLLDELQRRMQRLDASYRPGKPFVKLKFHDFTQTTLEQANASRDLDSYRQLLNQAFQRGERPVRLIGVGVRLVDLRGRAEQLSLF